MSKGNTFETELLEHILNNAAITLIGDAAGLLPSAADGDLFLSLHTADPGEGGTVTHFGVGTASSGAGKILYKGTVTPNLVVVNGVVPELTTGTQISED